MAAPSPIAPTVRMTNDCSVCHVNATWSIDNVGNATKTQCRGSRLLEAGHHHSILGRSQRQVDVPAMVYVELSAIASQKFHDTFLTCPICSHKILLQVMTRPTRARDAMAAEPPAKHCPTAGWPAAVRSPGRGAHRLAYEPPLRFRSGKSAIASPLLASGSIT